jgi:hypothetical protein
MIKIILINFVLQQLAQSTMEYEMKAIATASKEASWLSGCYLRFLCAKNLGQMC